jgi:hypothetical protein
MLPEDLPADLPSFVARFGSDEQCRDDLFRQRWPDGFRCRACGQRRAWRLRRRHLYECAGCGPSLSQWGLRERARSDRVAGRRDAGVWHQAGDRGVRSVDALQGGRDGAGGGDPRAAARPVRDGGQERHAGGPRGVRVLHQDARAPRSMRPGPAPGSAGTRSPSVAGPWSGAAIAAPTWRTTCGSTASAWRPPMRR